MQALLLVAHGSRNPQANAEIVCLTDELKQVQQIQYDCIEYAFMEFAEPSLPTVLDQLIAKQLMNIVLFPYFLSTGQHVSQDIPNIVATVKAEHPELEVSFLPCFGQSPKIKTLLTEILFP